MSENKRRKLLKSIAAGSGAIVAGKSLPENWTRPVVDSVMLPAHAQTTCSGTLETTNTPIVIFISGVTGNLDFAANGNPIATDVPIVGNAFSINTTVPDNNCSTDFTIQGTVNPGTSVSGSYSFTETCTGETCVGSGTFLADQVVVLGSGTQYSGSATGTSCCTPA